ncbi:lipid IV(A) 3-deoxy-D-manno-octulosonic acid transferase [Necropsobacter massiliensis]|uniref:lipid IV(A) 3-deoxy-D-manno-octulosonic acid transferase n=1 Tax=Necropsobacter massiliensis TaxID=1400001 RepID=UPI0005958868|nr:lipid IV(A) 3-deoxy-D-manno-octulosonic acid transferase [Necropsobacter massiliensis]
MWRFLYTLTLYFLQPFILLFMLLRSFKAPNYRKRLAERYGYYPAGLAAPQPHGVIIHAASVGEVIAATPLVRRIQRDYPNLPITLTTVTPTGSDRVKAAFGDSVTHVYLPYDLPTCLRRFIRFIQPKVCIVIETEIWPNLIHQLYHRGVPFIIANARLSARSAIRYGWIKDKLQNMLREIRLIAPQDEISGKRYQALGYNPKKLQLTGNIKYDLTITAELSANILRLRDSWVKGRFVWVAASTHEGEESIILETHRILLKRFPDLLLILVPRHPERFNAVAELIKKYRFNYIRRSDDIAPDCHVQVVLGDTMGELMLMYGICDVAFVGGSLVKHGGHNPLEPLAFKVPVISGKYTFNFPDVFRKLLEVQGALKVNENSKALSRAVSIFLHSPLLRERYGSAGHEVLIENRGALQRLFDLLRPYLEKQV